MPLPVENVAWPPTELRSTLRVINEWDTWYGGDSDSLTEQYEDPQTEPFGSKTWRFWARRKPSTSANDRRDQMHVPLAGDIASTSADLLFAAPADITVPGIRSEGDNSDLKVTQERLDQIVEEGGLMNRLLEAAEEAAALGGVYLRPTWDRDIAPHPILTHVTPERAVPTFRYGLLTEVTFWRQISDEDEKRVLRHLEHHSVVDGRAVIENALYEGTDEKVGIRIELGRDPRTAGLEDIIRLPVQGLGVRYVKNMGPARRLRGTPHGRSDFDGIEDLFDAVDEAWNSWMRDLRLGKARITVPEEFLERSKVGKGAFFDTDQEIFTPLNMDPTEREKAGIEMFQPEIRFESHRATVEALVMEAVGKAGYSSQTFGFHGENVQTATEVQARTDKTQRTNDKKRRYWEPNVEDILEIMLTIDKEMLDGKAKSIRPDIEWPDLAEPTLKQIAETVELLNRAEAASTDTMVRLQHPDWSDTDVADEVAKIMDRRPAPMANPFDRGPEVVPEDEEMEEDG